MALTVIQETNVFPVRDGWIWNTCLVQLPNGKQAWYDLPLRKMGTHQ